MIGIFAGFGVLLLVASPFLLLAAPCILCCKCKVCRCCDDEDATQTQPSSWYSLSFQIVFFVLYYISRHKCCLLAWQYQKDSNYRLLCLNCRICTSCSSDSIWLDECSIFPLKRMCLCSSTYSISVHYMHWLLGYHSWQIWKLISSLVHFAILDAVKRYSPKQYCT